MSIFVFRTLIVTISLLFGMEDLFMPPYCDSNLPYIELYLRDDV
jgi:hypothetical protein